MEELRAIVREIILKEMDTSYRGQHRIVRDEESTTTLDDMTKGGDLVPDDFYSHMYYYADPREKSDSESMRVIKAVKGKPNAPVTIYRAVPKGITEINAGDWISLSPTYAKHHGMHHEDESLDMPVIKKVVKAKDVVWDGNDVNEFAYFPS